ncbi:MAG: hypothetical protein CME38_13590 [Haliea sp.]|nr:hypothetical protein [Haliea sp.]|tara:strand:+ start:49 stop:909 length:861 start_codon:yes stop_codon:yes gene_type:complete
MKIALCMSGYLSGGFESFNYIKDKLLDKFDIDIFIHTWDVENENVIKQLYGNHTKGIKVQNQYDFKKESELLEGNWTNAPSPKLNVLSSAYGRKQSIALKSNYEKENNFEYDWVIYARFDLGVRDLHQCNSTGVNPAYRCCEIVFDPSFNNKYFYSKYWNQHNQGFADMWFYSNSRNMDIFATYYDRIFIYMKENSEYLRSATTSWFDSNMHDHFSNELFKKDKCENEITFPLNWALGNNHMMYKWFLRDMGLYPNQLRFPVDSTNHQVDMLNDESYDKKLVHILQ